MARLTRFLSALSRMSRAPDLFSWLSRRKDAPETEARANPAEPRTWPEEGEGRAEPPHERTFAPGSQVFQEIEVGPGGGTTTKFICTVATSQGPLECELMRILTPPPDDRAH